MKYYVRKKWKDESSQIGGEYTNLREAAQEYPYGYTVFNETGAPLIGTLSISSDSHVTKADYKKMWNKLKESYIKKLKNTESDIDTLDSPSVRKAALISFKWIYDEVIKEMEKIEKEYIETIKIQGDEK